eukprot:2110461-Pyramimonas_sp.AAC.1
MVSLDLPSFFCKPAGSDLGFLGFVSFGSFNAFGLAVAFAFGILRSASTWRVLLCSSMFSFVSSKWYSGM